MDFEGELEARWDDDAMFSRDMSGEIDVDRL